MDAVFERFKADQAGMWRRDYHAGTLGRNVARAIGGALRLASPYMTP